MSEAGNARVHALDDDLIDRGISINRMTETFADLLLQLIEQGQFAEISSEDAASLVSHLREAIGILRGERAPDARKTSRAALWDVERTWRTSNPQLAALAGCTKLCFADESEWDPDVAQDPTPIFIFLLSLRKALPGQEDRFVDFFRSKLLI